MVATHSLIVACRKWLKPELFHDYCPNGLQVEGRDQVGKIACAVTASQYAIDQAIAGGADLLLVHHGYFWKGEAQSITGNKKQRIQTLLHHDINLLAYHLPLDGHAELGNNAQLAAKLDLVIERTVPERRPDSLLCVGQPNTSITVADLSTTIEQRLGRIPLCIGDASTQLNTVAWCTGGAQGMFMQAIEQGVDAYITGEVSEQNYHQAQESGVCFIAAGHHATERYGVQALAERLATEFGLQWFFIEQDNPV